MARNTQVAADPHAPPITQALARFVATHPSRGWSDAVDHEAHRTFLNWAGCAVGAATHEAMEAALAGIRMLEPAPQATLLGRADRVDMAGAALLNGISSHTFDFDDTHLKTIIHPAGPVASAALALAEHLGSSGRALVDALVLGIDVACRMGNLMYPVHSFTRPIATNRPYTLKTCATGTIQTQPSPTTITTNPSKRCFLPTFYAPIPTPRSRPPTYHRTQTFQMKPTCPPWTPWTIGQCSRTGGCS